MLDAAQQSCAASGFASRMPDCGFQITDGTRRPACFHLPSEIITLQANMQHFSASRRLLSLTLMTLLVGGAATLSAQDAPRHQLYHADLPTGTIGQLQMLKKGRRA